MATPASPFEEVFEEELHEIRKRRVVSQMWTAEQDAAVSDEELRTELSGLALSGGGVRSAAFSLGLVQALYSSGRLKLIDFMSTVSGGGYTGALLSSEVALDRDGVNWNENDDRNRLSIESRSRAGQPRRVYDIALYGRRMGNALKLLSRHLSGWIVTIAFLLSGLVAIAAVLSWVMRMPWNSGAMTLLPELGFHTDIQRAFFPAFLAVILWLAMLVVSSIGAAFGWKLPPTSRISYLILVSTIVLGFLALLAIDDVGFDDWIAAGNISPSWKVGVNRVVNILGAVIGTVFAAMVAPYLMPTKLLNSGAQRSSPLQRTIFNFAGYGVLLGTPMIVFFILCTEDISGTHEKRVTNGKLSASNLKGFREFTGMLAAQKPLTQDSDSGNDQLLTEFFGGIWPSGKNSGGNSRNQDTVVKPAVTRTAVEKLRDAVWSIRTDDKSSLVESWNSLEDQRVADLQLSIVDRWIDFAAHATLHHRSGPSSIRRNNRKRLRDWRAQFADAITAQCLSDPGFFNFATSDSSSEAVITANRPVAVDGRRSTENAGQVVLANDNMSSGESGLYLNDRPFDSVLAERWLIGDPERREELRRQAYSIFERIDQKSKLLQQFVPAGFGSATASTADTPASKAQRFAEYLQSMAAPAVSTLAGLQEEFCQDLMDSVAARKKLSGREALTDGEKLTLIWQSLRAARDQQQSSTAAGKDDTVQAQYRTWLTTKEQELRRLITTTRNANWTLLCARYPDHFTNQNVVYAGNVNDADQQTRLGILWKSLLVFLIVGLVANLNTTCLHGVYRDELAAVWLRDPSIRLKDLDTCSAGGPLQLINCTMNHLSSLEDPDPEQRSRFVLTNRYCGSNLTGYRATELYQNGETSVADAIAISGAAVSTSNAGNQLYRIVLLLTNFRLGQWLRNPAHYREEHYWPSPLRALTSLLWNPGERAYCFLSDGGHLDNTGLASLLQRRCRFMIFADASYDPNYEFEDLRKVLQAARAKYHIEFELGSHTVDPESPGSGGWQFLDSLRPNEDGVSQKHFVVLRVRYPEKDMSDGLLIISKTGLTGDEPIDVIEWKRSGREFPHDPTSNQFLPADQFEIYVALGRHIGQEINRYLNEQGIPIRSMRLQKMQGDRLSHYWGRTQVADRASARSVLERDSRFDREHVDAARKLFEYWLNTPPAKADDSELEIISSWARSRDDDDDELREALAQTLIEAVQHKTDRIRASETAQLELMRMLVGLGSDIPRIDVALQTLADMEVEKGGATKPQFS